MLSLLQLRRSPWLHRSAGAVMLLHMLVVVLLSVAPDLHALLHDHSHDDAHHCAVTLFQNGTVTLSAAAPSFTGQQRWTLLQQEFPTTYRPTHPALIGKLRDRGPPATLLA